MGEFLQTLGRGAGLFAQQLREDSESDRADRKEIYGLEKANEERDYQRDMDDFNKNLQLSQQKIAEGRAKLEQDAFTRQGEQYNTDYERKQDDLKNERKYNEWTDWEKMKKADPVQYLLNARDISWADRQKGLGYWHQLGALDGELIPDPAGSYVDPHGNHFIVKVNIPYTIGSDGWKQVKLGNEAQAQSDYLSGGQKGGTNDILKNKADSYIDNRILSTDRATAEAEADVKFPGWRGTFRRGEPGAADPNISTTGDYRGGKLEVPGQENLGLGPGGSDYPTVEVPANPTASEPIARVGKTGLTPPVIDPSNEVEKLMSEQWWAADEQYGNTYDEKFKGEQRDIAIKLATLKAAKENGVSPGQYAINIYTKNRVAYQRFFEHSQRGLNLSPETNYPVYMEWVSDGMNDVLDAITYIERQIGYDIPEPDRTRLQGLLFDDWKITKPKKERGTTERVWEDG